MLRSLCILAAAGLVACGTTTARTSSSGGSTHGSGSGSGSGSSGHSVTVGSSGGHGASGGTHGTTSGGGTTTGGDTGTDSGSTGGGSTTGDGPYSDFPSDPIEDGTLPSGAVDAFQTGTPGSGAAPCLSEPSLDALVPFNWTPLLFEWSHPSANAFELRLHVDNQVNDLVVYSANKTYTVDSTTWRALMSHSAGHDLAITLRSVEIDGAFVDGPNLGAQGVVHLSEVSAPGTVVYWTSSLGTAFEGFTIGDAQPTTVLDPTLAGTADDGQATTCVACHTSSPDGQLLIYTRDTAATRAIDARTVAGAVAPQVSQVTPQALALLARGKQTAPVLSHAHYGASDAVAISVFQDPTLTANQYELIWTDLHTEVDDGGGWGIVPRSGDARQAESPAFRHDGTAVAYVSTSAPGEGVISDVTADDPDYDIYVTPYGSAGDAVPLAGASSPDYREYYPTYSPGDALVAFSRHQNTAAGTTNSYNQPAAEVAVVPAVGGTATRLRANDPPACSGYASPGLTNSWPRWAPSTGSVNGQRVYWLVFSSKRHDSSRDENNALRPQLYISAVVTEGDGADEQVVADYPALYVTSQVPSESNHTPAWDVFQLE